MVGGSFLGIGIRSPSDNDVPAGEEFGPIAQPEHHTLCNIGNMPSIYAPPNQSRMISSVCSPSLGGGVLDVAGVLVMKRSAFATDS